MYDIFSLPDFTFPKNFIWGSATAGYQIEGDNIHANYYDWERRGIFPFPSGKACNSYELYRDDVALIKRLGHQVYRFSAEWSRIEPREGQWDQSAIDHYTDEARLLKEAGIKVYLTLNHGAIPLWFEQLGGFDKQENLHYFIRYIEKTAPSFAPYVDAWIVLNESFSAADNAVHAFNCIRAHGMAYHVLKGISDAPVSSAQMALEAYPVRYFDEFDQISAKLKNWAHNGVIRHAVKTGELVAPGIEAQSCPEVRGTMDFWALNLYTRDLIDARHPAHSAERFPHKKLRMIDMDFYLEEMYPEGTTAMIEYFGGDGARPVYITENGCCCNDDRFRIVYLALYLSAIHDAIERGCDVRGYLYWSLMDNFEWGSGYKPKFGIVSVDRDTFARTPKPSALFYKEILENNGFSQEILRKYLCEMPSLAIAPRN